jgi:hypothetical protein
MTPTVMLSNPYIKGLIFTKIQYMMAFGLAFAASRMETVVLSKQRPPDFELPRFDRRMLVKEAQELMGVEIIDNDNGVDCIIGVLLQQLQLLHQ